jgi:hypothetical protein
MGKYGHILKGIKDSKPMGGFIDKFPEGTYLLALKRYEPVQSAKSKNDWRIESEWLVIESSLPEFLGKTRGWPWFINSRTSEHSAEYEQDRANQFLSEAMKTFTSDGDVAALVAFAQQVSGPGAPFDQDSFAELLSDASQPLRGMKIRLDVTERAAKDNPAKKYQNAKWTAVSQTLTEVAAYGSQMAMFEAKNAHPNAPNAAASAPRASGVAAPVPLTLGTASAPLALSGAPTLTIPGAR